MKIDTSPLGPYLAVCQRRVEEALQRWLPPAHTPPAALHEAMRYVMLGGGKRIRPVLVYAAGRALGVEAEQLDAPACAVELIHGYSLVHDDLPAMDDDDLRRGKPTCHKAFGEATALLTGDALQTLAFYVLARHYVGSRDGQRQMAETLAFAAGSRGMAGGQAMDLAAQGTEPTLPELENIHIHKTGALIRASVLLGAMTRPEVDGEVRESLDHYAKCIGLAFQIQDDILDVEGDTRTLGKTRGADSARNKPTYPSLLGLEAARERALELAGEAIETLSVLDERADPLRWIGAYIVRRIN